MSKAAESLSRLHAARASETNLASAVPEWLQEKQRDALAQFEEQGVPTRRLEDWKGTSLAALEALEFTRAGAGIEDAAGIAIPETDEPAATLVFVDGRFDAARSGDADKDLPAGVEIRSIAEVLREDPDRLRGHLARLIDPKRQALAALQTAFLEDGVALLIESGARLLEPLRVQFVSTGDSRSASDVSFASASFPRLLVVAGENSEATLLTEHVCAGRAPGFTNYVAEVSLARGARVEMLEIQSETAERIHQTSAFAHLERDAHFDSHVFTLGTGLVRSELQVTLSEPGAETRMHGFFLGRDADEANQDSANAAGGKTAASHIDHFTTVDHAAPQCTSDEEYRGVLGGSSKGVFRGRVIVRPDAQKTEARQQNPNLLISDKASVDTKPQLEIYADDVRASHGSTIGQLDEEALFFLRARGLDPEEARLLLTRAFAHSVVGGINNENLRRTAARRVDAALAHVGSLSSANAAATSAGGALGTSGTGAGPGSEGRT